MNETVLRTDRFEIEVIWDHSLYFSELDEESRPIEDLYLEWNDLKNLMAKPQ